MGKVGNLIGRAVFGVISIAVTAVASVAAQRYLENMMTQAPASLPSPVPLPEWAQPSPGEVVPQPVSPEETSPPEAVEEVLPERVPERVVDSQPNPLETETRIDPVVVPVEPADPQVGIILEEEQWAEDQPANSEGDRPQDNIMDTFWEKLNQR